VFIGVGAIIVAM
jgi:Niemann-Pick C1 protein